MVNGGARIAHDLLCIRCCIAVQLINIAVYTANYYI